MPPQFHGQQFPHIRHHTPSASPPIGNGGPFPGHPGHPGHPIPRTHTPQPGIGSRPGSRNDMRRMGPNMVPQNVGPPGASHPGITYIPTPPIYNPPPSQQPPMMSQPGPQYQYQHPPPQNHMQPPPPQPQPPPPPPQPQAYMDDRRASMPPAFSSQPPAQAITTRPTPSPQPSSQSLPQPIPHISPPPQPQPLDRRPHEPQPPAPMEPKTEFRERPPPPQPPLLNTETAIKKLPQRKSHSIFTPIEENRSILSQHLASFAAEPQLMRPESVPAAIAANAASAANRAQSVDVASMTRNANTSSPPMPPQRANTQALEKSRTTSLSSVPESGFTPPSRSNSLKIGGAAGGGRPRGPRLKVQIPDGASDAGSATAESNSPRNPADTATQIPQRHNSQSSLVLPPPSPSASTLLSAGATGPPNPFARPPPQQNVNGETPVSALPSRFLNTEFLPSPSSFYPAEWGFRGSDSNTLPSPLNFATPVVGSGPSFLRDDHTNTTSGASGSSSLTATANAAGTNKRKTPEFGAGGPGDGPDSTNEPKRLKVE